jgi:hypothetical protein
MFPLLLSSTSTSLETAASGQLAENAVLSGAPEAPSELPSFCSDCPQPLVFSLPLSMLVVFAALTYTAAPALSLGANNTVRYFFGSK